MSHKLLTVPLRKQIMAHELLLLVLWSCMRWDIISSITLLVTQVYCYCQMNNWSIRMNFLVWIFTPQTPINLVRLS